MNDLFRSASVRVKQIFRVDGQPLNGQSSVQIFLGRYFLAFWAIAVLSGFVFGLVAEFQVFKWNEHPAVSFGAFITPPVLLGWLALSPGKGALAGLVTLAAATLGHFVGAQFTAYSIGTKILL